MIVAELKGKLPKRLENGEDILTSNVFSFFKYTDRRLLQSYLKILNLYVSLDEAQAAKFIFWPKYENGTEPDLIIQCGQYYILFEAKYFSDFSPETPQSNHQIKREVEAGHLEACRLGKSFVYVAITAEYFEDKKKYEEYKQMVHFIWTNWQSVAAFLTKHLDLCRSCEKRSYMNDLLSLLIKKNLRNFTGYLHIMSDETIFDPGLIAFFDKQSSEHQKVRGLYEPLARFLQKFADFKVEGRIFFHE